VEPGETPAEAVVREIQEELGAGVHRLAHLGEIDNVFVYEGRPGHERVSVFDGEFEDRDLYARETVPMREVGWDGDALWLDLSGSVLVPLYPDGIAALLNASGPPSLVAPPKRTVEVVPYDPAWPSEFDRVRAELAAVLGPSAAAIHHIGSTSVPGLSAKPVIDVLVETPDLSMIDRASPSLERLGYEARGEYGIPGRRYFSRPPGSSLKVHVHCFESGHDGIARHLRFRDYLRAHPHAAASYGNLKRSLAATYADDRDGYQDAKAGFIAELLERAGAGAAG
jgi:GrpB-like predicted nucleotidyltransferase (UPF0157 family)